MRKEFRMLILLSVFPLLTSCNLSLSSKPVFKSKGQKITYSEINELYAEQKKNNIFTATTPDKSMPSNVVEHIVQYSEKSVTKRGNETVSTTTLSSKTNESCKEDVFNGTLRYESKKIMTDTFKSAYIDRDNKNTEEHKMVYQVYGELKKLYAVDLMDKSYTELGNFNKVILDNVALQLFNESISVFESNFKYAGKTIAGSTAVNNLYYRKGVYTIEYFEEDTYSTSSKTEVYKTSAKTQISFGNNNKIYMGYYLEKEIKTEILQGNQTYRTGDIVTTTIKNSNILKASEKKVDVKSIDINKYEKK